MLGLILHYSIMSENCSILGCQPYGCEFSSCIKGCSAGYAYLQQNLNATIGCAICDNCHCPVGSYYEIGNQGRLIGCQLCSQKCSECQNPYFCADGSCACKSCNYNSCIECDEGQVLIKGVCQIQTRNLDSCSSPCATCEFNIAPSYCTSCIDNYFLTGSACTICTSPCQTCVNTATTCQSCISGYAYQNSACVICESPCATCDISSTACTSCVVNFALSGSTCVCTSPCATCQTLPIAICSSCISGYTYYNNACFTCEKKCATCKTSASDCLTCHTGYILISASCICNSPCKTCSTNVQTCTSCISGYTLLGSLCPCTGTCLTCSITSNTCESCDVSKYNLDSNNKTCCTKPCNECTSAGCLGCQDGYLFNAGHCDQCTSNCATCSVTISTCQSCITNYTLYNNTCFRCSGCVTCRTSPTDCLSCPSGLYLDINVCRTCPEGCFTCDSATVCKQCQSYGYFHSQQPCSSCPQICPNNGLCDKPTCSMSYVCSGVYIAYQLDPISNFCCPKSCISCTAISGCTSCQDGYYLIIQSSKGKCTFCTAPCATCETSSTNCLTCIADFTLNNGNCTANSVSVCVSPCATCNGDPFICSSCISNYILTGSTCTCNSPCVQDGTITTTDTCKSCNQIYYICNPPCATCYKSSYECLTCLSGTVIQGTKCTCSPICLTCVDQLTTCLSCYSTYTLYNNTCFKCNSPCITCNTSPTDCNSCKYGLALSNGQCRCTFPCLTCDKSPDNCLSCVNGYGITYGKCLCIYPCLTCNLSPTTCTTCLDTNFNLDGLTGNCCLSPCLTCSTTTSCNSCIDGYYLNQYKCLQCTQPCLTCITTSTNCLTCININHRNQDSSCSCISEFYDDNNVCVHCQTPCLTCQSIAHCSSCIYPTFTVLSDYSCGCAQNKFQNSPTTCQDCQLPCASCSSLTYCISCIGSNYDLTTGICTCNSGYIQNATTFLCDQCNLDCLTCVNNIDYCVTCSFDHTKLVNGTCSCISPYILISPQNCQFCLSPCLTCLDTVTQCISCIDGYYLQGQQCIQCQTGCLICSNQSGCEVCGVIAQTVNLITSLTLPISYYLNGRQCLTCSLGCMQCIDSIICQICVEPYYYFENQSCHRCTKPCQTCLSQKANDDSIFCTSCINNTILIGYQCLCQDGYYLSNNTCIQCPSLCAKCSSSEVCLKCQTSENIIQKDSQCSCQDGYHLQNQVCEICSPECEKCYKAPNYCIKCTNQLMQPFNGICTCIQGYHLSNNNCITCDNPCATCSISSNYCTSCSITNSYVQDGKCICIDGYFQISPTECRSCQGNCLQCPSRNECAICPSGYYLFDQQCITCFSTCKTCEIQQSNLVCSQCIPTYSLVNNNCIQESQTQQMSTQNFTTTNIMNNQPYDQLYILSNQIMVEIVFIDIYIKNDFIVNVTYLVQHYRSKVSQLSIDNFDLVEFSYRVNTTSILAFDTHQIQFNFKKAINRADLIRVYIQFEDIMTEKTISEQIFIVTPYAFQSASNVTNVSANVKQALSSASISILISVILAALLGGFSLIFQICDIIQWLSTFYYLNVIFPDNVNYVFQNCNLQQFLFLPNFNLPLNQQNDPYYFVSPYKYMQNQVDPLFINNVLNDCLLLICPIVIYVGSHIYITLEKKYLPKIKVDDKSQSISKTIQQYFHDNSQYTIVQIKAILLKQIHLNMLDLMLACCLQLMSNPPNEFFIVKINTLFAVFILFVIIVLGYQIYLSALKHEIVHETNYFKESYECIYEGLNVRQFSNRFYGCIMLYTKILYIFLIVLLYDTPMLQTGCCASQYFLVVIYILYSNPYESTNQLILQFIPNLCVLGILLTTTFLAINEQIQILKEIEIVGWIIISFISVSMLTQSYFLLKHFLDEIIKRYKSFKKN